LRFLKQIWVQVLIGVVAGIVVGAIWPKFGVGLKPLGDAFVNVIKMIIGPVIFCTVVAGIARMNDMKAVGRVGLKAIVYFEGMSTIALIIGLGVALLVKPGAGFNIDPKTIDPKLAADYISKAHDVKTDFWSFLSDFLLHIIPDTFFGAFTSTGSLLQVVFVAVLIGFACTRLGSFGQKAAEAVDAVTKVFFSAIHILVRAAPVGAFGAMAFTIGKYGMHSLVQLGVLSGCFALTSALFVLVVLGVVCRLCGFSIIKYLTTSAKSS
jgi:aerobic C4-dicarboxylate transport protein